MSSTVHIFAFLVFVLINPHVAGAPQRIHVPNQPAGISQLIENREGRVSCWGVVIQLGNLRFKSRVSPHQIIIREAKHGHDLKETMTWRVTQDGRRLVIKFKPKMGDFGSGNSVEIQIDRTAFDSSIDSPNNRFEWLISTDVL